MARGQLSHLEGGSPSFDGKKIIRYRWKKKEKILA